MDDARSCARNVGDLFTPNLQVQRKKFCEYCERLIFSDPCLYGRKGEELLWRKGFYDVVATAKKLKKKEYLADEVSFVAAHINAGIGFYSHMISKLQCQFNLNMKPCIDFAMMHSEKKDTGMFLAYKKEIIIIMIIICILLRHSLYAGIKNTYTYNYF